MQELPALRERFASLEGLMTSRVVWRCATVECGVPSVMTPLESLMRKWLAGNWDIPVQVIKHVLNFISVHAL